MSFTAIQSPQESTGLEGLRAVIDEPIDSLNFVLEPDNMSRYIIGVTHYGHAQWGVAVYNFQVAALIGYHPNVDYLQDKLRLSLPDATEICAAVCSAQTLIHESQGRPI